MAPSVAPTYPIPELRPSLVYHAVYHSTTHIAVNHAILLPLNIACTLMILPTHNLRVCATGAYCAYPAAVAPPLLTTTYFSYVCLCLKAAELFRDLVEEQGGMSVTAVALLVMLSSFLLQLVGHKISEPVKAANLFHGFVGAPFLELVLLLMKLHKLGGGDEAKFWIYTGDTSLASLVGYDKCSAAAVERGGEADVFRDAGRIRDQMCR